MIFMRMIKRRRREGVTDYKKRFGMLKSDLPRVVVRKSSRSIIMQVVSYAKDGDTILSNANSAELKKEGWHPRCNIPTAYLTGALLARKAKAAGLGEREMIADIGLYRPIKSSVIFAAIAGCKDNGVKVRADIGMDKGRLSGAMIANYAKMEGVPERQFSAYKKEGFDPASIEKLFEEVRKKLSVVD